MRDLVGSLLSSARVSPDGLLIVFGLAEFGKEKSQSLEGRLPLFPVFEGSRDADRLRFTGLSDKQIEDTVAALVKSES